VIINNLGPQLLPARVNGSRFHFFKNPAALPHITRVTRSLNALKPEALASSLNRKVRDGILFQNKPVSSILKTCSGLYLPSAIIFLKVSFA
uniref:Uncharacterized protein n=1 Tax=Nothobranchius furzeri TaxID=105023 RepID=A0A8C6MJG9_NOTFU